MTARERAATCLLVGGYALAVWASLRFVPTWRERRLGRFLAFEAGTVSVATGHALRRRPVEAAVNAGAFVGLALAWVVTNRRR